MSYSFDVMSRVFETHIRKRIDPRIAMEFDMLIQEMHEANHRLKDAVNHDPRVSRQARELEEASKEVGRDGNV